MGDGRVKLKGAGDIGVQFKGWRMRTSEGSVIDVPTFSLGTGVNNLIPISVLFINLNKPVSIDINNTDSGLQCDATSLVGC